jgi:hypothetical protein
VGATLAVVLLRGPVPFPTGANSGWGQVTGWPLPMPGALEPLSSTTIATVQTVRPFAQEDRPANRPRNTTEKATGELAHLVQDLSSIPHFTQGRYRAEYPRKYDA